MDGNSGMGGGVYIYQLEYLILAWFLSRDARARSCSGTIGTGSKYYVEPRLISGEGLTFNHCGVETHGNCKWDPHLSSKHFYCRKGGQNFHK